jgi:NADPH-dependent curcumin reductase CurA
MGTWQKYILGDESDFIKLPLPSQKLERIIQTHGISALSVLNSSVATAYQILSNPLLKPGDVVCQSSSNGFLGKIFIQLARIQNLKSVNFVRNERYVFNFFF